MTPSEKFLADLDAVCKKFKCSSCNGSGLWQGGRTNRHGNHKCNTCHGRGFLVSSPEDRAKRSLAKAQSAQKKKSAAQEMNLAHGDGFLFRWLSEISNWNSFAQSLMDAHERGFAWSEAQIAACRKMYAKMELKRQEAQERQEAAPEADVSRITKMFEDALANGKKRRALHAGNFGDTDPSTGKPTLLNKVVMTPAQKPGVAIWVKVDDEFLGGIGTDGKMNLRRNAPSWLPERLQAIAANPDTECRLYGQRTGTCSCCGRELTNKISIDLGIGPICREKWGLA